MRTSVVIMSTRKAPQVVGCSCQDRPRHFLWLACQRSRAEADRCSLRRLVQLPFLQRSVMLRLREDNAARAKVVSFKEMAPNCATASVKVQLGRPDVELPLEESHFQKADAFTKAVEVAFGHRPWST